MSRRHRWFGLLLRFFPARFRDRHGEDMRDAFGAAFADRRSGGRLPAMTFAARTTLNLVASGLRERFRSHGRGPAPAPRRRAGGGGLVSWLDVKLGLRMLAKHPGLTLVSTFALSVGIPVGLGPAHFMDGLMAPLPVPEGNRIRLLRLWSPARGGATATSYHDFETWRPALSTFEDVGAYAETAYNVDAAERGGAAVHAAAVTASSFEVLQVRPLLGRTLQPADEIPGSENVAVIGYDLWQARFAGDPAIVGKAIRLGSVLHTVVGVMPEGFLFPKRQFLWTSLRRSASPGGDGAMPVTIFGRLANGTSDTRARAEFASVAGSSARPGREERLVPQVEPFAYILLPGLNGGLAATPEFIAFQSLALIVLLVACANVGMLIFARTATRAGELALRTALGADRWRIVAQVFTECLVLAVLAAGAGLILLSGLLDLTWRMLPTTATAALPHWIDWDIGSGTALVALGLAAVSAIVAGVVPALRFTGAAVQSNIQRARARRTGVRFGGLSGVLIVADVAVAVAAVGFAVAAFGIVRQAGEARDTVGIPAEEYLGAMVSLPPRADDGAQFVGAEHAGRVATTQRELVRRLRDEPGVRTVVMADNLPRMEHQTRRVEAEGVPLPDGRNGISSRVARVDVDFFEALDQPILAGRGFSLGDLGAERSVVIVNTTFVDRVLGGQNALGRRVRFHPWGDGEPGPWKEIVGVVGHLGMRAMSAENDQGVYEPLAPGDLMSVRLGIHLGGDPTSFAPRLRSLAGEVDPDAIVSVLGPLGDIYEGDWYLLLAASLGGALLVGVLLALAASGIYAIMSFAVAERTIEIGIRAALGAGRRELVGAVAKRAAEQIAVGVALGMPFSWMFFSSGMSAYAGAASSLVAGVGVMVLVGLAACTGPTLRALRVHPSQALRGDG